MTAVKKALQIIQAKDTVRKARIVNDSLSVLQHLQNARPFITSLNRDVREIQWTLSKLTRRGCQLTFTWCPGHCGNDLPDTTAKEGCEEEEEEALWLPLAHHQHPQ